MKLTTLLAVLIFAISLTNCTFNFGAGNVNGNVTQNGNTTSASPAKPASTPVTAATEVKKESNATKCDKFSYPDRVFIAKQTFPFDYEPFKDSCFVTFGSTEDMLNNGDVPRGSTFHIFTGNKDVFEFPDAFGGQPACWVEAVAFDDLNGDGKTDVIIAGKCLGAKDSYPSNAVFVNTGRDFTTDSDANEKLENFKRIDEIKAFVKKNQNLFF